MKIGNLDPKTPVTPVAGERTAAPTPKADQAAEASTQVELSSTGLLAGSAGGEFDAEKVERITQAIRDGKFKINAEAIADKLIANAQELLGRPSH